MKSPLVDLEMREIEEKIQVFGVDSKYSVIWVIFLLNIPSERWWDFRPLFRTRTDRYRAYMIILIGLSHGLVVLRDIDILPICSGVFGQLSGNGMITYFLPILLKNAGITNQNKILTLNFVNSVTS